MTLGFTGTQVGMTPDQQAAFRDALVGVTVFYHGDCIGADAEAAAIAKDIVKVIHVCPPLNPSKRAFTPWGLVRDPLPYRERNQIIVDASDRLFAAPRSNAEELRSGTWMTVRMAIRSGIPVTIAYPDGRVVQYGHPSAIQ